MWTEIESYHNILYFLLKNTLKFDPKEQQIYKQKNNKEMRRFNKF